MKLLRSELFSRDSEKVRYELISIGNEVHPHNVVQSVLHPMEYLFTVLREDCVPGIVLTIGRVRQCESIHCILDPLTRRGHRTRNSPQNKEDEVHSYHGGRIMETIKGGF
jgi:hypothetical protein